MNLSLQIPDSLAIRQLSTSRAFTDRLTSLSLLGTKFHFDKASCRALESFHTLGFLHLPIDDKLVSNDREQFNRKTRDLLINHFSKLTVLKEIQIFSEDMSIPLSRQWLAKSVDTLTVNVLSLRKTPHLKEDLFDGIKHLTIICSPNRKPPVVPFPFRNLESLRVHRAENQSGSIKRCYDAIRTLIHTNTRINRLSCRYVHPMDMSVIISGSRNSRFQATVDDICLDSHIRFRLSRLADPFYQPGSYNDEDEQRVTDSDSDADAMNGILWFLNVDSLSGILQELYNFSRLKRVRLPVLESCIHVMDIVMLAKRNPVIKSLVLVYRTQNYENYVESRNPSLGYVNKFFFEESGERGSSSGTTSSFGGNVELQRGVPRSGLDNAQWSGHAGLPGYTPSQSRSNSVSMSASSLRSPTFQQHRGQSPVLAMSSSATSSRSRRRNSTMNVSKLFVLLNPEDRVCTRDEFRPVDHVAFFYTDLAQWRALR